MIKQSLAPLLEVIANGDSEDLDIIVQAVCSRYKDLFPDWEITFLSLPCNDPNRRRQIMDWAIQTLSKSRSS